VPVARKGRETLLESLVPGWVVSHTERNVLPGRVMTEEENRQIMHNASNRAMVTVLMMRGRKREGTGGEGERGEGGGGGGERREERSGSSERMRIRSQGGGRFDSRGGDINPTHAHDRGRRVKELNGQQWPPAVPRQSPLSCPPLSFLIPSVSVGRGE
jgi:hypothetical protein